MLRDQDRQGSWLRPARVVALIGAAGLGSLALALALSSGQAPFAPRHEAGATAASRQADPPTEAQRPAEARRLLPGADPDDADAARAHHAALPAETAALSAEAARLRAAVAAERARLEALHQERVALIGLIAALRQEVAQLRGGEADGIRGASGATTTTAAARTAHDAAAPDAEGGAAALPLPPAPVPPPEARPAGSAEVAPAPPSDAVRVVVLHRANSVTAEQRAAATGGAVREAGFELAAIRPVGSVPAARVVRYFHASDAAAAARLAGRLGPGWAIQDFRALSPSPPPQTLELWLPDR